MPSGSPMAAAHANDGQWIQGSVCVTKPRYLNAASTNTTSAMPALAVRGAVAGLRRMVVAQRYVRTENASGSATRYAFQVAQNAMLTRMTKARLRWTGSAQKIATTIGRHNRYEYELNCTY